jgi:hypothetical protein
VAKSKTFSNLVEFVGAIKSDGLNQVYQQNFGTYDVNFHNETLSKLVRAQYTASNLDKIIKLTKQSREVKSLSSINGEVVPADAHDIADVTFDTHYDSIWTRDSCWNYLALKVQDEATAQKVLATEIDYLASQRQRIEDIIRNPRTISEDSAIHIRFDAKRKDFGDVLENGTVQPWNHKQNDALGFLLDIATDAWREDANEFDETQLETIALAFAYLVATKFWRQEDAGAWEEAIRRNTSSIALCTSAFENLRRLMISNRELKKSFRGRCVKLGISEILSDKNLSQVIKNGYAVIRKQIKDGGESPSYNKHNTKYRTADAALLSVIFPAKLPRLAVKYKVDVLKIVSELVREHGIIRYQGDTYQAGNFWFNDIHTDSDPEQLARRLGMFQKGTEAEWFFDSWYSICALAIYRQTRDDKFLYLATKHLNRALGQYTGENDYKANGHPVAPLQLPESYNYLLLEDEKFAAASPMTPLNWAKAAQTLMFDKWQKFLEK